MEKITGPQSVPLERDKNEIIKTLVKANKDIQKTLSFDNFGESVVSAVVEGEHVVYDFSSSSFENGELVLPFHFGENRDVLRYRIVKNESGILLSFDDDFFESWEAAFPLFKKHGAKVTFFVEGKDAQKAADFCTKAAANGHDAGYHSATHPDLRAVSKKDWSWETIESAAPLKSASLKLSSFAYPFGFYDDWMNKELLEKHYGIVRGFGTTLHIYNKNDASRGFVQSKSIDNTILKTGEEFRRSITDTLRKTAFLGGIIPFTTHDIKDEAAWGIKKERLEFLLEAANLLGLRFWTYEELGGVGRVVY
jgi:peptidoglycan/xylan/chitin deacetylase (PgdA/CDA1 family)